MNKKSNRRKKVASKRKAQRKSGKFTGKVYKALVVASRDLAKITCKILEYDELKGIEAEIAGELTNKYCYEYESKTEKDSKGNPLVVRGIRAVGVREAIRYTKAKLFNFIPKFTYEKEDLGEGWFREVVFCLNPKTGEITRSTCQWRRGDRFGDRTASTNAERNSMLKQLPAEMKLLFINYCVKKGYLKRVDVDPMLPENKTAITTLADEKDATNDAGKEKTAGLARIWAVANKIGVDQKKFRAWLHKSYKVASMKDIDIETQKKIANGLSDIYNNAPGRCAKPKANIMTCDDFVAMIAAIELDDKGEMVKK